MIGIEDSGAGVCAVRLAGFAAIGMAGGNIPESGTRPLCQHYCESFEEVLGIIRRLERVSSQKQEARSQKTDGRCSRCRSCRVWPF